MTLDPTLQRRIYTNFAKAVVLGTPGPVEHVEQTAVAPLVHRLREQFHEPEQEARPLPEVPAEGLTPERMIEATQDYTHPVVIRGLLRDAPAAHWTREALRERCGDTPCLSFEMTAEGTLASRGGAPVKVPFAEYLDRMDNEPIYLNNATELFVAQPELIDDLRLDLLQQHLTQGGLFDEFFNTQLFVGGPHVHSRVHNAPAGNAFVQLAGRKRWTLIDPIYTALLDPFPANPFQYALCSLVGYRSRRLRGEPLGLLGRLPRFVVDLEPGDVLYNTPWWWHEVENLDAFTVGVAVRHVPQPLRTCANWRNHALFTALSVYPTRRAQGLALMLAAKAIGMEFPALKVGNWGTSRRLRRSFADS